MKNLLAVVVVVCLVVEGVLGGYGGSFGWAHHHECMSIPNVNRGTNYFPPSASNSSVAMVTATDSQTKLPVVFFLGSDGGVWSLWKLSNHSNSGWSDLVVVGAPDPFVTFSSIAVAPDVNGILNVFAYTTTGALYRALQAKPTKSSKIDGCISPPPSGKLMPCTEFSHWILLSVEFQVGLKGFQAHLAGSGLISMFGVAGQIAYQIEEIAAGSGLFATPTEIPSKHGIDSTFEVAVNVDGLFEGFARRTNSHNLQRTWQDDDSSWTNNWNEPGTFPPNCDGNPNIIVKPDGLFELYIRDGDDMHVLREKSCKNSGSCDYGSWNELPKHDQTKSADSWGLATTVLGGTEVVIRGDDGNIYRIYQDSDDGKWDKWESIGTPPTATIASQPIAVQNGNGVLEIIVGRMDGYISFFAGPNTMKTDPNVVEDNGSLLVSWNICNDIAGKNDQVRVYPIGEQDPGNYIETTYVSGGTSPGKDPVPIGSHTFSNLYLPNGTYEVRYLIDEKDFVSFATFQSFTNGADLSPLNTFFNGLADSLGVFGSDPVLCISSKDFEKAGEDFNVGFTNYSSGAIVDGLANLGEGLEIFATSLTSCGKPQVGNAVQAFAQDMADCSSSCSQFNTTVFGETIYASRHNIDANFKTASSNWLSKEYQDSGVAFGLAVAACAFYPESN
eukprot:CAMPEP_0201510644 /NCGR_PEP_ID=MMETSP0161_2-20130828/3242_1 /ASSEMBLY_ACC=CAM_ASM_000251 /TAXON_ID=180227 /ORGANISM="Neoparamoeba aestuarina, Strain SoJaBio B1-5/56/2" /LENGTH=669 /DNA_ID=CAMNT_0047905843 /DNA_START=55 /DNA_END=2064 /DNA_ORIENTATION=+